MRAIAALLVVIHHAAYKGIQHSSDSLEWFHVGGAGIDLFFIISGYIMCKTVDTKHITFGRFMLARVRRIIPLYWVLTTFALIVYLLLPGQVNSSGGHTHVPYSYLLIPTEHKYLISNGWTLSYEFLFYFLFAAGLLFSAGLRYMLPLALIFGLVLSGKLMGVENYPAAFLTSPLLLEFAAGMLVFHGFKEKTLSEQHGWGFIGLAVLALIAVNYFHWHQGPQVIVFGIPMLLLFIGLLSLEPFFRKVKDNTLLVFFEKVGASSYSLYLSHPFVLVVVSIVLAKTGINQYGYVFIGLLTVCSILAGHACYLLLEKKLQRLTRHYLSFENERKIINTPAS